MNEKRGGDGCSLDEEVPEGLLDNICNGQDDAAGPSNGGLGGDGDLLDVGVPAVLLDNDCNGQGFATGQSSGRESGNGRWHEAAPEGLLPVRGK